MNNMSNNLSATNSHYLTVFFFTFFRVVTIHQLHLYLEYYIACSL